MLHINPLNMRAGFSNARSLREGRLVNCETILETPPTIDPATGVKRMTVDGGGHALGTDRNDNLLGSSGPDELIGLGRQRHHLGQPQADRRQHGH